MKRRLTVQLDEEIVAKAKVLAARRSPCMTASPRTETRDDPLALDSLDVW